MTVALIGATGTLGPEIVQALKTPVRVLTRNAELSGHAPRTIEAYLAELASDPAVQAFKNRGKS